ncbi:hypothetical protein IB267_03880 [Ensifer sp. ENS09]|uniref:hypothetical protein n=1 Tax=Ensifer sp. ENS09 TaxID=2769263 RepID=UPI001781356F|nr:hypothetical protein [Ensifer sp. ENS09]MBD9647490.1 hypothetical protein [Ensifer sp. ENS09]
MVLSALFLAAAISPASADGQFGKPRYLVKAFLLKDDKTFDHATNWCGNESICTLTVGDYEIGLRFFMGYESYRLRVASSWDGDNPCCFFADGAYETSVASGRPHGEALYYKTDTGRLKLGTLYIALESLH